MALLLLASLKAAGGAALLPLPYYLALVAMVLRLSRPRLLARRAHQRAHAAARMAETAVPRSNRMRGSTNTQGGGWVVVVVVPTFLPPPGFLVKPRKYSRAVLKDCVLRALCGRMARRAHGITAIHTTTAIAASTAVSARHSAVTCVAGNARLHFQPRARHGDR